MHPGPVFAFVGAAILVTSAGCAVFKRLAGKDALSLEKADVRQMGVDIRKSQKTICPRARVQMAVFADVLFDAALDVFRLHIADHREHRIVRPVGGLEPPVHVLQARSIQVFHGADDRVGVGVARRWSSRTSAWPGAASRCAS